MKLSDFRKEDNPVPSHNLHPKYPDSPDNLAIPMSVESGDRLSNLYPKRDRFKTHSSGIAPSPIFCDAIFALQPFCR